MGKKRKETLEEKKHRLLKEMKDLAVFEKKKYNPTIKRHQKIVAFHQKKISDYWEEKTAPIAKEYCRRSLKLHRELTRLENSLNESSES